MTSPEHIIVWCNQTWFAWATVIVQLPPGSSSDYPTGNFTTNDKGLSEYTKRISYIENVIYYPPRMCQCLYIWLETKEMLEENNFCELSS